MKENEYPTFGELNPRVKTDACDSFKPFFLSLGKKAIQTKPIVLNKYTMLYPKFLE